MSSEKSLEQRKEETFEERIIIAFNGQSLSEIARILDENPSSFWNWAKGRTDMPNRVLAKIANNTEFSLNWILTGIGSRWVFERSKSDLISVNEDLFAEKVRSIVQEELEKNELLFTDYEIEDSEDIQDLGDADGYDFEKAIDENKSPAEIFTEFFIYNDRADEIDGNFTLSFKGWNTWNKAEKLSQIKSAVETEFIMREHFRIVKRREEDKRQRLMKDGNLRRYKKRR